ncbi:MAG: FAD-binding protein [Gammaproteobacteria bacterium]|jgi:2-octaprenylphenol hydroxylase|nr:FAD-binding protein [Gammaproteobacteria bacterium]
MNKRNEQEIEIVGAGLVGLTLAHLLAKQGFCLSIIDKAEPNVELTEDIGIRVSAVNRASENIFKELGLWQNLQDYRMGTYERMVVWDEGSQARIELDAAEIGEANLGHIIENQIMLKVLWQGLQQYQDQVSFKVAELSSEHPLAADLVVGADGAKSWLRSKVGIESSSHDFKQQALVCTVHTEKAHRYTAWQKFLSTGPLAFLPLHDPHLCSIVWSTTQERAAELAAMSEQQFNTELGRQMGPDKVFGECKLLGLRACYPLHQHHAKEYVREGIALIGDAAHSIHPLAGQGLNLGFADAKVLAEVLSNAKKKGRNLASKQTLLQYQRARKHYNAAVMWSMYGFNGLFSNRLAALACLRQAGFNWINKQSLLKRFFIKQAMGINE